MNETIFVKYKPGSKMYVVFAGDVYRVKIRAVGYVETERSQTYHIQYIIPIGTSKIKANWIVGEKVGQLYQTYEEAKAAQEGAENNG